MNVLLEYVELCITAESDIPYISHEIQNDSDNVSYYYTSWQVKIQPNPSYNLNSMGRMGRNSDSSSNQYTYIEPDQRAVCTPNDDLYEDVSGVHEYITIT